MTALKLTTVSRRMGRVSTRTQALKGFMPALSHRLYGRLSVRWARFRFEQWCSRIAAMEHVPFKNDLFRVFLQADGGHAAKNALARLYRFRSDRLIAAINRLSDERRVLLALFMRGIPFATMASRQGIAEEEALRTLADALHQLLRDALDDVEETSES